MANKIVTFSTKRNQFDATKTIIEKVSSDEWEQAIIIGNTKNGEFVVHTNGLTRKIMFI